MSDLPFTVRKKRKAVDDDNGQVLTPKKARISRATPSKAAYAATPAQHSASKAATPSTPSTLPPHLALLLAAHNSVEQALSLALATAQVAPDQDTGRVTAVLNHLSIRERGLGRRIDLDDLKRLCWLWEWDAASLPMDIAKPLPTAESDMDDNPFLVKKKIPRSSQENPFIEDSALSKDWTRGGMGFVLSVSTHMQRDDSSPLGKPTGKRVPVYGIGIEVDWEQEDVVGGRVGGMVAVARWTAAAESRKRILKTKLERWEQLHQTPDGTTNIPSIPVADLPALPTPPKMSTLTKLFATSSQKAPPDLTLTASKASTSRVELTVEPFFMSPLRLGSSAKDSEGFKIPFPLASGERPVTPSGRNSIMASSEPGSVGSSHAPSESGGKPRRAMGIRTPSFGRVTAKLAEALTPTSSMEPGSGRVTPTSGSRITPVTPSTPVHQTAQPPATPTSARRMALYERIRAKSQTDGGEAKKAMTAVRATVKSGGGDGKKIVKMVDPEELRKRCILGRLSGVAEAVWMFFSVSGSGSGPTPARKRKVFERNEVVNAIVKSSQVPISNSEALESLTMLCDLCPFFLRAKTISGEDWLEMPASTAPIPSSPGASPALNRTAITMPTSPSRHKVVEDELLNRSPKRIKREEGGLRRVREIIRKELEVDDNDL